jgi:hypothetical protein
MWRGQPAEARTPAALFVARSANLAADALPMLPLCGEAGGPVRGRPPTSPTLRSTFTDRARPGCVITIDYADRVTSPSRRGLDGDRPALDELGRCWLNDQRSAVDDGWFFRDDPLRRVFLGR